MNRIVDRNISGRDLGLLAAVVSIASFTAFLLVAVLALWGQVNAQEEDPGEPQPAADSEKAEEAGGEGVIQKSSFGSELGAADAALRDLLMLVQVELFLAEADLSMPAEATEERYRIEEDKIYFGNAKKFQKPCVIEAQKVYDGISSYQKIVEHGFTKDNPEYWPLMRKAAAAFVRALKEVCKTGEFDLVGEIGAIDCREHEVPDVTKDVLKLVVARNK
jgi:hypothetical protein